MFSPFNRPKNRRKTRTIRVVTTKELRHYARFIKFYGTSGHVYKAMNH